MKYTTIRIEGSIFSADILDKIEQGELGGQAPGDFGFDNRVKVKDEIARAWADSQGLWTIFKHQVERPNISPTGTTETRKFWFIPFIGMLGYDVERARAETVKNKTYAVSHRAASRDGFPVHIMGFKDSLDKKREEGGPRMSPHALVQEYLNLTEHLYAIVTNGTHLRLLRDSSRLIKLSYIEFNLETMMEEEHFADFAVMYRLLHASRMPVKFDAGADSLIEQYHQDSLDSGSRIREGLCDAVENSIVSLADGFLNHAANDALREKIQQETLSADRYYLYLLRLVYRLLFLMVVEERDLVYPKDTDRKIRSIYTEYYSVSRLRKLSERPHLVDKNYNDHWISLKNTFRLFESEESGKHLHIKPLAGDLFGPDAIGILNRCSLDNKVLLECLRNLCIFIDRETGQKMRVNYAALNVEEFGSVYEGLLEYDPVIRKEYNRFKFSFKKGEGRSSSGSHYTPDELVQPLIRHSLDHVIEEKLKENHKEKSLLSITVCDVACGSGHILLNAARRIGTALAKVRTGEDQPSPGPLRKAIREVIQHCIYGVDKNPLAVELCKVALWLEAHNPGEPLNFLDHHIKCGDAIVGIANMDELEKGIADEAFKSLPRDNKEVAQEFAKLNKKQRKGDLRLLNFDQAVKLPMHDIATIFKQFNTLPEDTPEEIEKKRREYTALTNGAQFLRMKSLADIQVAQFFIPKTEDNMQKLITDAGYRKFFSGYEMVESQQAIAAAQEVVARRFFHWFLEFPEVFSKGGFDCILGNPPFLGNRKIKGKLGADYLEWVKYYYAPAGAIELVGYFFRRIFDIIRPNGFQSLIATNTISQGAAREGGLEVIENSGGTINFAIRSMKWPGLAAVEVSLLSICKGKWKRKFILDNKKVDRISIYLDDSENLGNPYKLRQNLEKSFIGSYILGKGFILSPEEASNLIYKNAKNKDVIFPYLTGDDLNSRPDQSPSRFVINFFDWEEEKARSEYPDCYEIIERLVKPERQRKNDSGEYVLRRPLPQRWWQHADKRPKLYRTISESDRVLVVARISKTVAFSFTISDLVFADALVIIAHSSYYKFSILQSSLNYNWSWQYCTTMKADLNYTPTQTFETFPFPQDLSMGMEEELEKIGEEYHQFRRQLMMKMQLGLTKTYNQFHNKLLQAINEELTPKEIEQKYGKETANLWKHVNKTEGACSFNQAVEDIFKLRQLHKQMDESVLKAYGWTDIDLAQNFYQVDYLPENDRTRYTISPEARKEILKRLLELNHQIHDQEVKTGLVKDKNVKKSSTKKESKAPPDEFKLTPETPIQKSFDFTQKEG